MSTYYDKHGKPADPWGDAPLFLGREETARELGVSVNTVDRMVTAGRLPHVKALPGKAGRVLIPYRAVLQLVEEAYQAPTTSDPNVARFPDDTQVETLPNGTRLVPGVQPARFGE